MPTLMLAGAVRALVFAAHAAQASSDPVDARERTRLRIERVRNHLGSRPQMPSPAA